MKMHELRFFENYDEVRLRNEIRDLITPIAGEQNAQLIAQNLGKNTLFSIDQVEDGVFNLVYLIPKAFVSFQARVKPEARGSHRMKVEWANYSMEYAKCKSCKWLDECRGVVGVRATTRACKNMQIEDWVL